MSNRRREPGHPLRRAAAAQLLALLVAAHAGASPVVVTGTLFDLTYDDALLGAYGTPTVSGSTVFFSSNAIVAQRFLPGTTTTTSLLQGLVITMRDGYRLDSLDVGVFGDYLLEGRGSGVSFNGTLSAFDAGSPAASLTSALMAVDPATPLDIADGLNRNWRASARVDGATAVNPGQSNVFGGSARSVGVSLETQLTASVAAGAGGFVEAFIEQKFSGLQLVVRATPAAVPAPGTAALLAIALVAAALASRRRS